MTPRGFSRPAFRCGAADPASCVLERPPHPARVVSRHASLPLALKERVHVLLRREGNQVVDLLASSSMLTRFVTITKGNGEWQHLKPAILGAIMEHFMSGDPLIADDTLKANVASGADDADEFFDEADKATVNTIKELLETRIRPAVAGDGGDIVFRGFRDGVVYLAMKGSCSGCPSSTATLKNGVQNLLRHFLPDVREVQAI